MRSAWQDQMSPLNLPIGEEEASTWTDWMQDSQLDPWKRIPCQLPPTHQASGMPTLKDLYSWKEVCVLCDRAGVYKAAIAKQRPDQFPTMRKSQKPSSPMPKGPPRTIALASCVPEPPENEVMDWTPPSNTWTQHAEESFF